MEKLTTGVLADLPTHFPSLQLLARNSPEERRQVRHSGTTIVALSCENGKKMVMAADRQTTSGFERTSVETIKIHEVSSHSLFGGAGLVAYIQDLKHIFTVALRRISQFLERDIYIDGQARLMENILKRNFLDRGILDMMLGYVAVPILAGWDPINRCVRIFSYDEAGGIYEATGDTCKYVTIGSGGFPAKITLDEKWGGSKSCAEATELAIRAILRAGARDIGSSLAPLHPPMVYLVSKNGIEKVDEELVLMTARVIAREDARRRGDKIHGDEKVKGDI